MVAVEQIERKKPQIVLQLDALVGNRAHIVGELGGLALHDHAVGTPRGDLVRGENARRADMLNRGDIRRIAFQLLVPKAVLAAVARRDEHLVHRRVKAHPGVALGERSGVLAEQHRQLGVLKIADPVRQPEMQQIHDRRDAQALHLRQDGVGELPIVFAGARDASCSKAVRSAGTSGRSP